MIITEQATARRKTPIQSQETQEGDILNIAKFNALHAPVTARLSGGGGEYWIESLCVQTGLMRLDVCGQIDNTHFEEAVALIDDDGNEHDPDDFWI